jgi:hypothetical protein
MANSPYQLFLQLVPVQCVTWGLLKHEISTMESSAKLQVVRRSLMKKQDTKALSQTSVMNSHGTTALLTCGSLETFKKIVKNLFFQKAGTPSAGSPRGIRMASPGFGPCWCSASSPRAGCSSASEASCHRRRRRSSRWR